MKQTKMHLRSIFLALLIVTPRMEEVRAAAYIPVPDCTGSEVNLLVLGDSQTGGSWATSYFGDFLQSCLSRRKELTFAVYARGGTQMDQWTNSAALDSIPTVYRDPVTPRKILGKQEVPLCLKRASSLIKIHQPEFILLQFGDNLLSLDVSAIEVQTNRLLKVVEEAGIDRRHCYFATPTYEMAVESRRNVPAKNIQNTMKVRNAIEKATLKRCTLLDGTKLLAGSPILNRGVLERILVPGTTGCAGAARNDNTHACGEAARAWAEAICKSLTPP